MEWRVSKFGTTLNTCQPATLKNKPHRTINYKRSYKIHSCLTLCINRCYFSSFWKLDSYKTKKRFTKLEIVIEIWKIEDSHSITITLQVTRSKIIFCVNRCFWKWQTTRGSKLSLQCLIIHKIVRIFWKITKLSKTRQNCHVTKPTKIHTTTESLLISQNWKKKKNQLTDLRKYLPSKHRDVFLG